VEKSFELFDEVAEGTVLKRIPPFDAEESAAVALSLACATSWWRPGLTANGLALGSGGVEEQLANHVSDAEWAGLICASAEGGYSLALSPRADCEGSSPGEALVPLRPDRLVLFNPARVSARILGPERPDETAPFLLICASNRDRSSQ
jgi:hypothetical protein